MQKLLSGFIFLAAFIAVYTLRAQVPPSIEWQKSLGGTHSELANSIQQTADGGYIVVGFSNSGNGDVTGWHGGYDYNHNDFTYDYWIVKLDATGSLEWQKCLGGSDHDEAKSIQQTTDGGFIIAGWSRSIDGDVTEHLGLLDFWIVKLDMEGNLTWQKSLGGSSYDNAFSVQQTFDGGFIVAGYSNSTDGDVSGLHGYDLYADDWIVKLDTAGDLVWQKCLGGDNAEVANSIKQTTDGGFIVAGSAYSNDGDVSGHHDCNSVYDCVDYWILKLDTIGNLVWQKCYGGSDKDVAYSIEQTSDGGFIVAGISFSNDGDVTGNHGDDDYWVLKLDINGNLVWQKSLGGSDYDEATSIKQTMDGGFIVAGYSNSNDGDVSGFHGNEDYWIVNLDTDGNLIWQKCLGGSSPDIANSIQQTTNGGFIVAGVSYSNDGDVSANHGLADYWVVKLSPDSMTGISSLQNNFVSLYPNPVHTQLIVNLTTALNESTIVVYDLQGGMITLPTTFTNAQAQLNTTSLPDGFYTLQITNNKTGASEVGKFVKQQ